MLILVKASSVWNARVALALGIHVHFVFVKSAVND